MFCISVAVSFLHADIGRDARRGNRARRSVTASKWRLINESGNSRTSTVIGLCSATRAAMMRRRGHIHSRRWLIGPGPINQWVENAWLAKYSRRRLELERVVGMENKLSMESEWWGYSRWLPGVTLREAVSHLLEAQVLGDVGSLYQVDISCSLNCILQFLVYTV